MTQKMTNQMESGFDKKQAKYTESDRHNNVNLSIPSN